MKSALTKFTFMVFGLGFLSIGPAFAQQVSGQISRVGDATHLEFAGRTDWNYDDPVKDGNKLTFVLPAFDEVTETRLRSWSCPFVKEVQINKSGPDGKYAVTFVVADQSVESFDYQTDEPSHLVIDFYKRTVEDGPAPVVAGANSAATATTPGAKAQSSNGKKARTDYTKADGRSPASEILVGPGSGNMVVAEKPALVMLVWPEPVTLCGLNLLNAGAGKSIPDRRRFRRHGPELRSFFLKRIRRERRRDHRQSAKYLYQVPNAENEDRQIR